MRQTFIPLERSLQAWYCHQTVQQKKECRDCPAKAKPQIMWRISLLHILWLGKFSTYFLTILNLTCKYKIMLFWFRSPIIFVYSKNVSFILQFTKYLCEWLLPIYPSFTWYLLNNSSPHLSFFFFWSLLCYCLFSCSLFCGHFCLTVFSFLI